MPGHTHAVGLAYPELAEAPVLPDEHGEPHDGGHRRPRAGHPYEGIAVGFSSLRIHEEATYDFVADVFGELAAMTPGPYLHLGGDESLGTDPDDFAEFVARATAIVADLGKIADRLARGRRRARPAPRHDRPVLGVRDAHERHGREDPGLRPPRRTGDPLPRRCDLPRHEVRRHDARSDSPGRTARRASSARTPGSPPTIIAGVADADILGVEAPLWSETIRDLDDIDTMAFPRIAAAAEAAWSPPTGSSEQRTWASFRTRVGALGPLWTSLGIRFHASPEIPWVTE